MLTQSCTEKTHFITSTILLSNLKVFFRQTKLTLCLHTETCVSVINNILL
jgi:hypothetical protein